MKIKKFNRRLKQLIHKNLVLIAGVVLISAGLLFGGYNFLTVWWSARNNHAQAFVNNEPSQNSTPLITGTPVRISIPDVNIDLKVIPGYYYPSTKSWTLSLNDAQWGAMTAKPNNKQGDTFIYAHYRLHVFYTLPKIKPGDEAVVTTSNDYKFTYRFTKSTVTSPSDTSLFSYKGKPILVLQTCTGLWYQNRQLFVFDLVKFTKTA